MKTFRYKGIDKRGKTVSGSTTASSEEEVRAQLKEFGFQKIRIQEEALPVQKPDQPEPSREDIVHRLIDGDIEAEEPVPEEEEEEYEWERAEAFERIRRHRYKENVALAITLIVIGVAAAYFIFDKITEIEAPQPWIVTKSSSELLSFKDVYVKGQTLVFIIYAPKWNGNVRVDYKAWDPVDKKEPMDFGTARIGFIGDHYRGSAQKSGTFRLKKMRFYDRIEIRVSGDEKR